MDATRERRELVSVAITRGRRAHSPEEGRTEESFVAARCEKEITAEDAETAEEGRKIDVAALGPLRVLCGKFSRLSNWHSASAQREDARGSGEAEREAAEDIGEPVLADVHTVSGRYEWPADAECGGLTVC